MKSFQRAKTIRMLSNRYFNGIKNLYKLNYDYTKTLLQKKAFQKVAKQNGYQENPTAKDVLDQPYLFVLSTGRSGTALLTEVLSKSRRLRVEHSPNPELEYVSKIIHRDSVSLEALKIGVISARFDAYFLDSYLRGKIYVETNNRISLFAPALAELLPNARFVHLVRNPAAFVRSGMRRGYYDKEFVQHQRLDGSYCEDWDSWSRVEKIAFEWNEINKKIEEFKAGVATERVITMNSEKLFSDVSCSQHLFDFIGLESPFKGRRGRRKLEDVIHRPVNEQKRGKFPEYREWDKADRVALQRQASLAKLYGYQLNQF